MPHLPSTRLRQLPRFPPLGRDLFAPGACLSIFGGWWLSRDLYYVRADHFDVFITGCYFSISLVSSRRIPYAHPTLSSSHCLQHLKPMHRLIYYLTLRHFGVSSYLAHLSLSAFLPPPTRSLISRSSLIVRIASRIHSISVSLYPLYAVF